MTEITVQRVSTQVSWRSAAMRPRMRPTTAPRLTAAPPIRMEIGRRVAMSWEIGVFFEIL